MAGVALGGWLVFLAVGAGWRSWLQWRRTGDHGFRALSARFGSTEQITGVMLVAGAVVSVLAPVLVLWGVTGTSRALAGTTSAAAGLFLVVAGIALTVKAQLDMGASWRIGVDRAERTSLCTQGLYRFVRNPIYVGMFLVWIGEAWLVPNALSLAGVLLMVASIEVLVRAVEEPYLLGVHGEAYRAYTRRVGRFVPGLGRLM